MLGQIGLKQTGVKLKLNVVTQVVLGSLFLVLCSYISIPLSPVPLSFQNLAIFILAIGMGGKRSASSVLLYLAYATVGLPVLAGGLSDPLWMIGVKAGYFIGFPIAAYVIGKLTEKRRTPLWTLFSVFCGHLIIYFLGVSVLSYFIGLSMAIQFGFVPFILVAILKAVIAVTSTSMLSKR